MDTGLGNNLYYISRFRGGSNCSSCQSLSAIVVSLPRVVEFLDQHHQRFPFADLITGSYLLADVTSAFEAAADPRSLRIAIEPSS